MKQMTVKELLNLCILECQKGNSNKNIVISNDNEGNGYHGLFFGFGTVEEVGIDSIYDSTTYANKDTVVLG